MIPCVGGLSWALKKVEYFICLIARLLQITPSPSIVLGMLRKDTHKYLRVAALFAIRLIGGPELVREALAVGWDDYRKICVHGDGDDMASSPDTRVETEVHSLGTVGEKRMRKDDAFVVPKSPHYFILLVDELTDALFGIQCLPDEQTPKTDGSLVFPLVCASFLGLSLPPILSL